MQLGASLFQVHVDISIKKEYQSDESIGRSLVQSRLGVIDNKFGKVRYFSNSSVVLRLCGRKCENGLLHLYRIDPNGSLLSFVVSVLFALRKHF